MPNVSAELPRLTLDDLSGRERFVTVANHLLLTMFVTTIMCTGSNQPKELEIVPIEQSAVREPDNGISPRR